LARQNLLLQKGVQSYGQSKHEELTIGLHFIPNAVGSCPLYSDWLSLGAQSAHDWVMLHLEFGGGVDSNFGIKIELSEQEPRTASC
jgi:hypothetical protein